MAISSVVDAIKIFNDVRFRREADRLSGELKNLPADSDEAKTVSKKIDALIANIGDDLLKPKKTSSGAAPAR